jgi:hypothetical protein
MLFLSVNLWLIGGWPFSPGELTAAQPRGTPLGGFASHAAFEEDCAQCHEPWQGVTTVRCERCHSDVATQRAGQSGLHGRMVDAERCLVCHTDHQGRAARITVLSNANFDHATVTGFSLARHALNYDQTSLACDDCHRDGDYSAQRLDCVECHVDGDAPFMATHRVDFGDACVECHDGVDRMAHFDHASVFVLDGAHAQEACIACHANRVFKGTARECVGCHAEPPVHAGQFGTDCSRCHTTTAWTPAQLLRHIFPLDHGGEGKIECQTCHTTTYAVYTCYNCHAHPVLETEQLHRKENIFDDLVKCAECHPTGLKDENGKENDH